MPRKMMKFIIEKELKAQGEEIFNSLIKCKDLGQEPSNPQPVEDDQIDTGSHKKP